MSDFWVSVCAFSIGYLLGVGSLWWGERTPKSKSIKTRARAISNEGIQTAVALAPNDMFTAFLAIVYSWQFKVTPDTALAMARSQIELNPQMQQTKVEFERIVRSQLDPHKYPIQ